MLPQSRSRNSQSNVVGSPAQLRKEWQEAVDRQSLIEFQASVGILLGGVVTLLVAVLTLSVITLTRFELREFIPKSAIEQWVI
jgi:hypothetical protein